jgi:hemolysin activation/secretion protein
MDKSNADMGMICQRAARLALAAVMVCSSHLSNAATLDGTVIVGSQVYSPAALFPAYRDVLGRSADSANARAVLASIESLYVHDGYFKPQLVVRDDLLHQGILRIDVYEAQLTDVKVSGNAGPYRGELDRVVGGLRKSAPLRRAAIPAALKKLRALPGLTVTATTRADATIRNGVVLALGLTYRPLAVTAHYTNRGLGSIGPNFLSAALVENGLLGQAEQFGVLITSGFQYSEYHGGGAFLDLPLDRYGTSLSLSAFHSNSQPTLFGSDVGLRLPHDVGNVRFSQVVADLEHGTLTAHAGLDYDDTMVQFEGANLESDRLRVAVVGLDAAGVAGTSTPYSVALQFRRGLDALGSGVSYIDGTVLPADYSIARLDAALVVPLGSLMSARLNFEGQLTGDVVPYEERFKIGTEALGRAFNTAVIAGDSGAGIKGQVVLPVQGLGSWFGKPSVYGYADYGTAWLHDLNIQQYATTVGSGLALDYRQVSGSLELGKPVGFSASLPHGFTLLADVTARF